MQHKYHIKTEAEMLALGATLAQHCQGNEVIYLQGNLGAGKTTLVRGFLRSLGYEGNVKSPTFTLVESYKIADKNIYHFDLYRLNDPEELEYIGIRDYCGQNALLLIEWPEYAGDLLPPADIICAIEIIGDEREVCIQIK